LPLHAAGIYDGPPRSHDYCANYIVSSYTPTLTTLLRVQRSTSPIPRRSISVLLAGEKQAHDPRLKIIPGVDAELEKIAATAKLHNVQPVRRAPGPTAVCATRDAMLTANVVHLACHGVQDSQNMTQSGFCLGDGRLTISVLMKLRIDNAFLAFLSACETAKGDKDQPDQAMHLAAAMLFVGFKAVIATMWYV
jgi:CHAT domain-containing protein